MKSQVTTPRPKLHAIQAQAIRERDGGSTQAASATEHSSLLLKVQEYQRGGMKAEDILSALISDAEMRLGWYTTPVDPDADLPQI